MFDKCMRRKQRDMEEGEKCERRIESLLKERGIGTFKRSVDTIYDLMNDEGSVFIEIKCRYNYRKDTLQNYIIGKNKMDRMKKYPPSTEFYFICCFKDGDLICKLNDLVNDKDYKEGTFQRKDRGLLEQHQVCFIGQDIFKNVDDIKSLNEV